MTKKKLKTMPPPLKREPIGPLPIDRKAVTLTVQYLHWALIQAHKAADADCKEVLVRLDLERQQSLTSYLVKEEPSKISAREADLLLRILSERVEKLKKIIGQASGSLYPAIWSAEIGELENLFFSLTGHLLTTQE